MADTQTIKADLDNYASDIRSKRKDLFKRRRENGDFIKTSHSSTETKQKLDELNKVVIEIDTINESLHDIGIISEFKDAAKILCDECEELYDHARDIDRDLSRDLSKCTSAEEKSRKDVASSLVPLFTVAAAFVTGAKSAGGDLLAIGEAAIMGAFIGGALIFNKEINKGIRGLFSTAGKAVGKLQIEKLLSDTRSSLEKESNAKIIEFKKSVRSTRTWASQKRTEATRTIEKYRHWRHGRQP